MISNSIPKNIYFVWQRGKKLPDFAVNNIRTWHHFFPDFRIRMIDTHNCGLEDSKIARLAYQAKRYAYASDYMRLKHIYKHGGVYFDLDVEVIRDMHDIIEKGAYFGIDSDKNGSGIINTGSGFAAPPGHPLIRALMLPYEKWDGDCFLREDGFPAIPPCPDLNFDAFREWGFVPSDTLQEINGVTFYPSDYFCPMKMISRELFITERTRSIHHYTGSGNAPIDLWVNRYHSKLTRKNNGKPISYQKFRFYLYFFHPIKGLRYHLSHKKRNRKKT